MRENTNISKNQWNRNIGGGKTQSWFFKRSKNGESPKLEIKSEHCYKQDVKEYYEKFYANRSLRLYKFLERYVTKCSQRNRNSEEIYKKKLN